MNKICFVVILFVGITLANAQQNQSFFRLIYAKGTVESTQKKSWVSLTKVGTSLPSGGMVKVGPQSDVVFANDKNEVVRLRAEGTYAVADFAKHLLKAEDQSLATHYLRFVAKQIVNREKVVDKKNKEVNQNYLAPNCLLWPLDGEAIELENLKFAWKNSNARAYTFKIFADPEGIKKVYEVLTRDTLITFKEDEEPVEAGGNYWWTVEARGGAACEMHAMRVNSDALRMQDSLDFENLRKQLDFSTGMNHYIEGEFWRERGSWPMAGYYYKQAGTAEPDNDFFRLNYSDFKRYLMALQR